MRFFALVIGNDVEKQLDVYQNINWDYWYERSRGEQDWFYLKDGKKSDKCFLGDIDFDRMRIIAAEEAKIQYQIVTHAFKDVGFVVKSWEECLKDRLPDQSVELVRNIYHSQPPLERR